MIEVRLLFIPRLEEFRSLQWIDNPETFVTRIDLRLPSPKARTRLMPRMLVYVQFKFKNGNTGYDYRLIPLDEVAKDFSVSGNRVTRWVRFHRDDLADLSVSIDQAMVGSSS